MKYITLLVVWVAACGAGNTSLKDATVVDAGTQETTQFGAKINNTDSLTAGKRGATLLEDFMLREKVMHFGTFPLL